MTQVLILLDERVLRGFLTFSSGVLSGEGTVASPSARCRTRSSGRLLMSAGTLLSHRQVKLSLSECAPEYFLLSLEMLAFIFHLPVSRLFGKAQQNL